jgi:hypothetical protein
VDLREAFAAAYLEGLTNRVPLAPPPVDPLQALLDAHRAMTRTIVCNPDDAARVRAAVDTLEEGPPVRVVTSTAIPVGKLVTWDGDLSV